MRPSTVSIILKSFSGIFDPDVYLGLLEKGEKMMDDKYTFAASRMSRSLFERQDVSSVARKRRLNARILHFGLDDIGLKHLYNEESVPFFVPVFLDDKIRRDEIREKMFNDNIYCPVHWPEWNPDIKNPLYDRELSLICDQRYDEDVMNRILEVFKC